MRGGTCSGVSAAPFADICASAFESVSSRGARVILVVEDDPQVGRLVALVLKRNGRDCQVVADGTTAFKRVKENRPQLILADLTIKGMSGSALCSALKGADETRSIPYV